ncbi:MAG: ABC transporter ATP-binding protein [Chloroflexota bacterium]
MVHQHFSLVPSMTVSENVALGGEGRLDLRVAAARVRQIGEATGLSLDPHARVESLPASARQRLEIVKALARNAHILILDEPTGVLTPAEATELLTWLRHYARNGGTVVVVTHKLREALATADDVTVLYRGRTTLSTLTTNITERQLTDALFGGSLTGMSDHTTLPAAVQSRRGPVVARAIAISIAGHVRDATFDLHGEEIVGVAGIEGAGHAALMCALAGRMPVTSGELLIPDVVGFVPEDRQRDGAILAFTLAENVALRCAGARRGRLNWVSITNKTTRLLKTSRVKAHSSTDQMYTLSGGNQQKLIIARELDGDPSLLVVVNPTRGLDVRATWAVYDSLRVASQHGAAVLFYSSDVDELLLVASRILVVHAGRVREVVPARHIVIDAMLGMDNAVPIIGKVDGVR